MKTCNKCKETKELTEFSKCKARKDGLQSYCKECFSIWQKSERGKEAQARANAKYQKSEKGKKSNAKYKKSEKGKKSNAKYQQTPKGKAARANVTHKRRMQKSKSTLTSEQLHMFKESFKMNETDYQCQYCADFITDPHLDHIVPLSRGGTHELDNLTVACPACNQSKGNKLFIIEWTNRSYKS